MPDQTLRQIQDRLDIQQTLNLYSQSIDRADVDALRHRVFMSESSITLLDPVDTEGYCAFVVAIMKEIRTQHFTLNSVIELNGDEASARSYFIGFHRVPGGKNSETCDAIFGKLDETADIVIGGTYDDILTRTSDGWRIKHRQIQLVWQQQGNAGKILRERWLA